MTTNTTPDLIREMQENVAKYGRENTTTFLMVQAINELQRLHAGLDEVRRVLVAENEREGGPITDTIWRGPSETLLDYIDNLAGGENTTPSGAAVLQEGSTVYVLNARGFNRWWASVQPGQDDEGKRTSDDECKQIAHAIRAALSAAQDAPAVSAGDALPTVHRTAPERIYLCIGDEAEQRDAPFDELADITWSHDQPVDVAVPYVRADLLPQPAAKQKGASNG